MVSLCSLWPIITSTHIFEIWEKMGNGYLSHLQNTTFSFFLSQVHKIISVRGAQHVEIDIVSFVFGITCRRVF